MLRAKHISCDTFIYNYILDSMLSFRDIKMRLYFLNLGLVFASFFFFNVIL